MTSSQSSSGVAEARGTSASARLGQYRQLYEQRLLSKIFSREMHRPSGVKEWQMPAAYPFPMPPALFARADPEEEHETSYFALYVRIFSRSASIMVPALLRTAIIRFAAQKVKHLFVFLSGFLCSPPRSPAKRGSAGGTCVRTGENK